MEETTLVDMIYDLYERIQTSRTPLGLFVDGSDIRGINPTSQRFQQVELDYPTSIIGVYTKHITYEDFTADMMQLFRDMSWIKQ